MLALGISPNTWGTHPRKTTVIGRICITVGVFEPGIHDNDIDNPSDPAIIQIPMDQASKLPVQTVPLPENPRYYVVGIDVFHQLHCLVTILAHLFSTYYPIDI